MLKEFKEFAFKGNLVDMAVGFILGGAFATVVKSLVDNVIMPPLGMLLGGIDFKEMKFTIKEAVMNGEEVTTPAVEILYGQTIADLVSFILLAFVVFVVVKKVIEGKKEEEVKAPAAPPAQEVLLSEIRDLLKK